ncbi:hypothetical protein [Advenella kashmirensis]|uniref:hypothetical protein n=1 Tax=Advenella kashmirensis TaxID=310575 RepID=UPI0014940AB1|nr:hypothetical protein [Advenella kashmirensis]
MDITYSKFGGAPEIINADEDLDDAEPITLKKRTRVRIETPYGEHERKQPDVRATA